MNGLFSELFISSLVSGGVIAGIPLIYAGLGEAISERAGVLNVGLEGMMLGGAYGGFVGARKERAGGVSRGGVPTAGSAYLIARRSARGPSRSFNATNRGPLRRFGYDVRSPMQYRRV